MVSGPVPPMMPPTVSERPLAPKAHVCAAPSVRPELIVRFCVAAVMSIPEPFSVSVFPAPIVTGPPGLVSCKPAHVRFVPSRTEFGPVTVLFQRATSAAPGTVPPTQLVVRFKLSTLLSLTMTAADAACGKAADPARSAAMLVARTKRRVTIGVGVIIRRLGTEAFRLGEPAKLPRCEAKSIPYRAAKR